MAYSVLLFIKAIKIRVKLLRTLPHVFQYTCVLYLMYFNGKYLEIRIMQSTGFHSAGHQQVTDSKAKPYFFILLG